MPVDTMQTIPETRLAPTTTNGTNTNSTRSTGSDSAPGSSSSHDTGFHEPFSLERNTTLKHPDAVINPDEKMATLMVSSKHHKRIPHPHLKKHPHELKQREEDMGAGKDGEYAEQGYMNTEEDERREGKLKKVVHKLSCWK